MLYEFIYWIYGAVFGVGIATLIHVGVLHCVLRRQAEEECELKNGHEVMVNLFEKQENYGKHAKAIFYETWTFVLRFFAKRSPPSNDAQSQSVVKQEECVADVVATLTPERFLGNMEEAEWQLIETKYLSQCKPHVAIDDTDFTHTDGDLALTWKSVSRLRPYNMYVRLNHCKGHHACFHMGVAAKNKAHEVGPTCVLF